MAGEVHQLTPLIRRITAPNPGVMTGPGTNTYLVGATEVAVVDPGPDDPGHLAAIAEAGQGRIRWILLTHTHVDHAPGAAGLARRTGAEILAFDARDGIAPSATFADGDALPLPDAEIVALHTPGHASNHLCWELAGERVIFSGDHVMEGSTVVISPPDGDMAAYLDSLRRVRDRRPAVVAPGHGALIDDPKAVLDHYIEHRLAREEAIAAALAERGAATIDTLVADVYTDVPQSLHPIARHSVHAHLLKLAAEGRASGGPGIDDGWSVGS